jgi:hypothetical protein
MPAAAKCTADCGCEAPAQGVERDLAGLMIAPDHQQVLARCAVPARRIVVDAAVAHIHAGDNAVAQRPAALDDPPAHARYVVIGRIAANARTRRIRRRRRQSHSPPLQAMGSLGLRCIV